LRSVTITETPYSYNLHQAAGVPRKLAATIGISVDPRRQNLSEESLSANVARLKEYMSRLILFPRRNGKTKSGDASVEDVKTAKDGKSAIKSSKQAFPIENKKVIEEMKISEVEATEDAYKTLRKARSEARLVGKREKRARDKAEAEEKK